ncbi:MAG: hypothetical protein AAF293_12340 [Pseudomonadota bacterium]
MTRSRSKSGCARTIRCAISNRHRCLAMRWCRAARITASTTTGSTGDPTGNFIGVLTGNGGYTTDATSLVQMVDGDISVDVSTTQRGNSGQNLTQNNMAPFVVHRYCVALTGINPSRN